MHQALWNAYLDYHIFSFRELSRVLWMIHFIHEPQFHPYHGLVILPASWILNEVVLGRCGSMQEIELTPSKLDRDHYLLPFLVFSTVGALRGRAFSLLSVPSAPAIPRVSHSLHCSNNTHKPWQASVRGGRIWVDLWFWEISIHYDRRGWKQEAQSVSPRVWSSWLYPGSQLENRG